MLPWPAAVFIYFPTLEHWRLSTDYRKIEMLRRLAVPVQDENYTMPFKGDGVVRTMVPICVHFYLYSHLESCVRLVVRDLHSYPDHRWFELSCSTSKLFPFSKLNGWHTDTSQTYPLHIISMQYKRNEPLRTFGDGLPRRFYNHHWDERRRKVQFVIIYSDY